ncbi:MAG: molybdenum cofactor guanylyltransferase [Deltaproteobacteria bacterium HGW-Deltaproteobacteria-18]|nr:MAG: molybdenum cofactor guanylyltransferase [Deltaproteobacteria bacterium HGW-Deltaproteobacteria-20]PKN43607.1 MAG: molybdenum cofactor guanylyltransferase [Deltaproteobacteria bacterium HGW-Deltaproteobacteria-18]
MRPSWCKPVNQKYRTRCLPAADRGTGKNMIGLVLAGGKSSRLGQDKTRVVHEGQTLLTRTATLLQRHVDQVYLSCRHAPAVDGPWPVITDETERIGPAGGIITALRKFGAPTFVLACDLPFMEDSIIERLMEAREKRPQDCVLTTWQLKDSGFIENLVAIYEPQALPLLENGVAQGLFKLSRLIPAELRHSVIYTEDERHIFFNVNYPADLEQLQGR